MCEPRNFVKKVFLEAYKEHKTILIRDRPIFDLLNIGRYTNFHRYFGVFFYSTLCTNFSKNLFFA